MTREEIWNLQPGDVIRYSKALVPRRFILLGMNENGQYVFLRESLFGVESIDAIGPFRMAQRANEYERVV